MDVDENSSAFKEGLRPADLITHINGEAVQGLYHTQVLQLLLNNSKNDHVMLRATPLEYTSIQSGGRKRNALHSKLAKKSVSRNKKQRKDAEKKRKTSLFRRISTKRASADLQQMAAISSPVNTSATGLNHLGIPPLDIQLAQDASQPLSPSSSAPNTPTGHASNSLVLGAAPNHNKSITPQIYHHHHHHHHQRPSTLHGLKHKLHSSVVANKGLHHAQSGGSSGGPIGGVLSSSPSSSNRRKSVGHIPLSPLARTPSPSPLPSSPTRSPSPLAFPTPGHQPGASNTTQSYSPGCSLPNINSNVNCSNLLATGTSVSGSGAICAHLNTSGSSPNAKKTNFARPKSAEPGSPLLRRALSPDRLHPRSAENKCIISPLCCNSQLPSISNMSINNNNVNSGMSIGMKKQRHSTGSGSSVNVWRNQSVPAATAHTEKGDTVTVATQRHNDNYNYTKINDKSISTESNVTPDKSDNESSVHKPNTNQISSGMLSLSLQSQSELLPIAEEKDSPTGGGSVLTGPTQSNKETDESGDRFEK